MMLQEQFDHVITQDIEFLLVILPEAECFVPQLPLLRLSAADGRLFPLLLFLNQGELPILMIPLLAGAALDGLGPGVQRLEEQPERVLIDQQSHREQQLQASQADPGEDQ